MQAYLKPKPRLVIALSIVMLLASCSLFKALRAIKNKDVKPHYYMFHDKSIIFTPLTHFGQNEYYNSLKDSLIHWKENGYTIFYEQIISDPKAMNLDSISVDGLRRKWRKIVGGEQMTREGYSEFSEVFKNGVAQPEYVDLGIDSADFNADITLADLVNKFEEYYGEVKIDSCDYATHLDSTYTCSKKLKGKLIPVIIDYRNEELVKKIVNSDLKEIVVLYGGLHLKGMKKLLDKEQSANKY